MKTRPYDIQYLSFNCTFTAVKQVKKKKKEKKPNSHVKIFLTTRNENARLLLMLLLLFVVVVFARPKTSCFRSVTRFKTVCAGYTSLFAFPKLIYTQHVPFQYKFQQQWNCSLIEWNLHVGFDPATINVRGFSQSERRRPTWADWSAIWLDGVITTVERNVNQKHKRPTVNSFVALFWVAFVQ